MTTLPVDERATGALLHPSRDRRRLSVFVRQLARSPVGAASALVILLLLIGAAFAPWVAPYDPASISRDTFADPGLSHLMGTDSLGRDVFSRILYGARVSIRVGLLIVFIAVITGTLIGLLSGYLGGAFDLAVQRVVDAMMAIPALVLVMALISVLTPSTNTAMIAIAIALSPAVSRVVRGTVLSIKQNAYIEAATASGASSARIMLRHILPNVMAPVLIMASVLIGAAILIESSLTFLGLGTQPPDASWGQMLSRDGRQFMERQPWLTIWPGLAITLTVLAFNLLGDVVRDILDPRLRGSR